MVYDSREYIAQRIKTARLRSGLTQEELAEKINISTQQISRIETGMYVPSLPTFLHIADVLNLTLEEFGVNNSKKENETLKNLIFLIHSFNETELECCFNNIQALIKNFEFIKAEHKKSFI